MDRASNVAERARQAQSSGQTSSPKPMPLAWVESLFAKMAVRYLHKWSSAFPTPQALTLAKSEWSTRLSGITWEQVASALEAWDGDWPPSSEEFRRACIGKRTNESGLNYIPEVYRQRPERDPKKLLSSDARNAKRLENRGQFIGAMRGVLGKSTPEPARIDPTREADRKDFAVMKALTVLRSDHSSIVTRLSLAGYL